eukprot:TRINITY_DN19317_c0_g1_i9.p1 TRINITY_DN19317_c0_g1~~TRINITY_DN19317_c0_g1_i9.p1  ORF type:complete len:241 (+),score=45.04 TRINITY_DN19317_c0_g1_i9:17-739(+)
MFNAWRRQGNGRRSKTTERASRVQAAADVNRQSKSGGTALMNAATLRDACFVDALLQARADPDVAHETGCTALHAAAKSGCTAAVGSLLKAKADPNVADEEGVTPLIAATEAHHMDVVNALLDGGADPDAEDVDGEAALDIAEAMYDQELPTKFKKLEDATGKVILCLDADDDDNDDEELEVTLTSIAGENVGSVVVPRPCSAADVFNEVAQLLNVNKRRIKLLREGEPLPDLDSVPLFA